MGNARLATDGGADRSEAAMGGLFTHGEPITSAEQVTTILQHVEAGPFERLIVDLWERMGWTTGRVDEGFMATRSDPPSVRRIVSTHRGPDETVGPATIRTAAEEHWTDEIEQVSVVTTTTFEEEAVSLAAELDIDLIDGTTLVHLLAEHDAADLVAEHVPFVSSTTEGDDEGDITIGKPGVEPSALAIPRVDWYWVVVGSTALWLVYIGLERYLGDITLYLALPAWALLPVALYFDSLEARRRTGWPRYRWIYIVVALVPVIAIVSGVIYLLRRFRVNRRYADRSLPDSHAERTP